MRKLYKDIKRLSLNLITDSDNFGDFYNKVEELFLENDIRSDDPLNSRILIPIYNGIGDGILTIPFIREVRKIYPNAEIMVVCLGHHKDIFKNLPYIDHLIPTDGSDEATLLTYLLESLDICEDLLWEYKPTLSFQPKWSDGAFSAMSTCWLSGSTQRIGYGEKDCLNYFEESDLSKPLMFGKADEYMLSSNIHKPITVEHEVDGKLYILESMGYTITNRELELRVDDRVLSKVKEEYHLDMISSTKVLCCIGSGLDRMNKEYPIEKYAEAFKQLKDITLIITSSPHNIDKANQLTSILGEDISWINTVGRTTIEETMALAHECDIYIGNDTGTVHMCAAFKKPCIVLQMQTKDKNDIIPQYYSSIMRFKPYGTKNIVLQADHALLPCNLHQIHGGCIEEYPHCITQITPQQIVDAYNILVKDIL